MTQIAFLGAGAMGARMITNLLQAGFEVRVWNRNVQRLTALVAAGASQAQTPAEAANGAEFVISMLTDDEASRAVWLEMDGAAIDGLDPAAVAIECSSISPGWSRQLASALQARDLAYVEAPVVGSRPQAEAGQLIHLLGAAVADLERVRPLLEVSAASIRHVGPVGTAMVAKLAVNALFAAQISAFGEVMAALRIAGLSDTAVTELFSGLPVTSPALVGIGNLIAAGDDEPRFPIDLVAKDLRYFSALPSSPAQWPVTAATLGSFEAATASGLGERNINAVVKLHA